MSKIDRLKRLGYLDNETKDKAEELLNRLEVELDEKTEDLDKRINNFLAIL